MPGFIDEVDQLQLNILEIKKRKKAPGWVTAQARAFLIEHERIMKWLESCGKEREAKRLRKALKERLSGVNQYM